MVAMVTQLLILQSDKIVQYCRASMEIGCMHLWRLGYLVEKCTSVAASSAIKVANHIKKAFVQ